MSIRTLFENISEAIKEKNTSVTNVTPSQMPDAIRDIISGGLETITETEWENLTAEQKRMYDLVGIIQYSTGFNRGIIVNGKDYSYFDIHQNYVDLGSFNINVLSLNEIEITFNGVNAYNGLILNYNNSGSNVIFNVLENNTTIECGICNLNGSLPSLIQSGVNRVRYFDYMNTSTGTNTATGFNKDTMRIYLTSYTTANVSFKVRITVN